MTTTLTQVDDRDTLTTSDAESLRESDKITSGKIEERFSDSEKIILSFITEAIGTLEAKENCIEQTADVLPFEYDSADVVHAEPLDDKAPGQLQRYNVAIGVVR